MTCKDQRVSNLVLMRGPLIHIGFLETLVARAKALSPAVALLNTFVTSYVIK
jgi:hypothetical protein